MRQNARMLAWILLGAGAVGAAGAWAQGSLPDPTRPPGATVAAPHGSTQAVPTASGLSSVILRKGAKPAAVIDGQYVELGGKVGERKVVRIAEGEVVLKNAESADGRETLLLTPGIEKQPIKQKAVRKAVASGAKQ
ncbi:MAG: hypothetical protein OHM77_10940 [Candidatus Nitricoxidivorans perseverans]|uniref:MSHA biogenesis protein MshK n=1 Tax=Candidatus Nitricoxidivorans perseverans TaxID=2975601 RepID=A0AA49IVK3_9PROT|nr:MAG: hypothetical protein OHM77_10940 [Candidatus Nitricoxidivorans perseverans]